jgi:hypothetical protein
MHERDRFSAKVCPHQVGMNNTGVKGLTEAEKATLKAPGAVEDEQ